MHGRRLHYSQLAHVHCDVLHATSIVTLQHQVYQVRSCIYSTYVYCIN